MNYILTSKEVVTVEKLLNVLSECDKKFQIFVKDDNEEVRPIHDIAEEENHIIICDF